MDDAKVTRIVKSIDPIGNMLLLIVMLLFICMFCILLDVVTIRQAQTVQADIARAEFCETHTSRRLCHSGAGKR